MWGNVYSKAQRSILSLFASKRVSVEPEGEIVAPVRSCAVWREFEGYMEKPLRLRLRTQGL